MIHLIKELTEQLFKSATIYGTALVCICLLIDCVGCSRSQVESVGTTVCADTDSLVKPLSPDTASELIDPVEDSCLE